MKKLTPMEIIAFTGVAIGVIIGLFQLREQYKKYKTERADAANQALVKRELPGRAF